MSLNKEIIFINNLLHKQAIKDMKPLLQTYKKSLTSIRSQINDIMIEYLDEDGNISVSRQRRYSILKEMEKQLLEQAKEIGYIEVDTTTNILTEVFKKSYYMNAFTIDKGITGVLHFALLNPKMIESAVKMPIGKEMFSDRIWKNKELLVNRVRRDLEKAMTEGTDPRKLAKQITKDFNVSAYEAERLIRTETARCVMEAQDEIYNQSNVVVKVLFDATLDNKTSRICQDLDGQYFEKDNHPKIPQDTHPNCRSCIIPVIEGWTPTKKRDNQNKSIIDYTNYEAWAKSKGIKP